MVLAARALAFLRGRDYAFATDVRDLARDVLRHRIVLSYEALAEEMGAEDLLGPILDAVPIPAVPLRENPSTAGSGRPRREHPSTAGESPWTRPQP